MWKSEAVWVNQQIVQLGLNSKPVRCLNLGSSTREYRVTQKPYIDELVMKPLSHFGSICHVDVKANEGVDEVGDFCDPAFLDRLCKRRYDLVLCNNLLTHVTCRARIFEIVDRCLDRDGYAIITAPSLYPYCADPYDAKYRPSVGELTSGLPGLELVTHKIIRSNETHAQRLLRDPRLLAGLAFNILLPLYGLARWRSVVSDLRNLFKNFETTCVVLHRHSNDPRLSS